MAIKQDNRTEIVLPSVEQFRTKAEIRNFLLNKWIIEPPQTKYRYFVEILSDGSRIYLERPALLNKGCDFVILIENLILFKNGNDKPPTHNFLLEDLTAKKYSLTPKQSQSVINAIQVIYDIGTFHNAIQHLNGVPQTGLPYETILKLVRWFFIEQDITDWATSGREMLFNKITQNQ